MAGQDRPRVDRQGAARDGRGALLEQGLSGAGPKGSLRSQLQEDRHQGGVLRQHVRGPQLRRHQVHREDRERHRRLREGAPASAREARRERPRWRQRPAVDAGLPSAAHHLHQHDAPLRDWPEPLQEGPWLQHGGHVPHQARDHPLPEGADPPALHQDPQGLLRWPRGPARRTRRRPRAQPLQPGPEEKEEGPTGGPLQGDRALREPPGCARAGLVPHVQRQAGPDRQVRLHRQGSRRRVDRDRRGRARLQRPGSEDAVLLPGAPAADQDPLRLHHTGRGGRRIARGPPVRHVHARHQHRGRPHQGRGGERGPLLLTPRVGRRHDRLESSPACGIYIHGYGFPDPG
mmetsp:Transcript_102514/g.316362  ORF Transcript_102514/g.316362 Transcript_102514/m.316362 type:complete len:346 (-) Transcript_102514:103-1140(-)